MTQGPAPRDNAVRRNAHPHAQQLPAGTQPGRELPKRSASPPVALEGFGRPGARPQTAAWTETDWAELELTTKLVDGLFLGDLKLAGEIRQRVAKWGATVEDRARLRMTFETTDETEPEAPSEAPRRSTWTRSFSSCSASPNATPREVPRPSDEKLSGKPSIYPPDNCPSAAFPVTLGPSLRVVF